LDSDEGSLETLDDEFSVEGESVFVKHHLDKLLTTHQ
jgi:hypothetical protein